MHPFPLKDGVFPFKEASLSISKMGLPLFKDGTFPYQCDLSPSMLPFSAHATLPAKDVKD
jgi:hypothetical protein